MKGVIVLIEILNVIKDRTEYRIQLKAERSPFYRSDKISNLLDYIEENSDRFIKETYEITYDTRKSYEYIKSFQLDLLTDCETYNYVKENYRSLLEHYNKDTIFISYKAR